jgi:AraC-like DNA-binding protein
MHSLQSQVPRAELRRFVRAFAQREIANNECSVVQPIPARLEQTLEFQLGSAFEVTGPDGLRFSTPSVAVVGCVIKGGASVALRRGVKTFVIFFQPTGFSELFGLPNNVLAGTFFEASAVLGRQSANVHECLAAQPTFSDRVLVAEEFLLAQAAKKHPINPVASAANEMFARKGVVRIAQFANRYGTSERHFVRQFRRHIGICPKLFARVARFQAALDSKIAYPARTWLEIALDMGYHDQMHLVHDFHGLAGDAPGRIVRLIGDSRPHAALS